MNKLLITVATASAMIAPAIAQTWTASPTNIFGEGVAGSGIGTCYETGTWRELTTGVTLAECKGSQTEADRLTAITRGYTLEQTELLDPSFDPANQNIIRDSEGNTIPLTPEELWDPANGYVTEGVQNEGRVIREAAERRARERWEAQGYQAHSVFLETDEGREWIAERERERTGGSLEMANPTTVLAVFDEEVLIESYSDTLAGFDLFIGDWPGRFNDADVTAARVMRFGS